MIEWEKRRGEWKKRRREGGRERERVHSPRYRKSGECILRYASETRTEPTLCLQQDLFFECREREKERERGKERGREVA